MANYTTLRRGNGYTEENKRLQQALKDAGYGSYLGSLGVDGVYGSGTESAVRAYQRANNLQEDGIAGDETLGSLYGSNQSAQTATETVPVAAEPEKNYRYDHANDPVYQAAQQKVTELEWQKPTIQGTYDQQMQQLYQELMGQKEFDFDLNGNPLWQQYEDQYTTQGKLAMMDAMGQAAALTGGHGSSFAQSVGQQTYQGYLQQLNDRVPELYQLALQKYNNDQAMLKDKLSITQGMADSEYAKDIDKMNLWYTDMGLAKDDANIAYDRGQNAWYTEEQLRRDDENTAYSKQQDQKNWLLTAMTSTGYVPSDAELAAAGMFRDQANAFVNQYKKEMAAATSGGYRGSTTRVDDDPLVMSPKDIYTVEENAEQWAKNGEAYLDTMLGYLVENAGLDISIAEGIMQKYFPSSGGSSFEDVAMTREQWKQRTGSYKGYEEWYAQRKADWEKRH